MKKRVLFWAVLLGIFLVASRLGDPLQVTLNLFIGGIVPGLNISLGFLPTIVMLLCILLLMRRVMKSLHFQMLRHASAQAKSEAEKSASQIDSGREKSDHKSPASHKLKSVSSL